MRKYLVLLLILTAFALPSAARNQRVQVIQQNDQGVCKTEIRVKTEHGNIVAGCKSSLNSKIHDAYIVKSDAKGNKTRLEKSVQNDHTRRHYIQEKADGSTLEAGCESSGSDDQCISGYVTVKSAAGKRLWTRCSTNDPTFNKIFCLDQDMEFYLSLINNKLDAP
ncbi:MAG: hypothetical protein NTW14_07115 [bacterium]|nr:hypothetical protein [bacterium]